MIIIVTARDCARGGMKREGGVENNKLHENEPARHLDDEVTIRSARYFSLLSSDSSALRGSDVNVGRPTA